MRAASLSAHLGAARGGPCVPGCARPRRRGAGECDASPMTLDLDCSPCIAPRGPRRLRRARPQASPQPRRDGGRRAQGLATKKKSCASVGVGALTQTHSAHWQQPSQVHLFWFSAQLRLARNKSGRVVTTHPSSAAAAPAPRGGRRRRSGARDNTNTMLAPGAAATTTTDGPSSSMTLFSCLRGDCKEHLHFAPPGRPQHRASHS